MIDTKKIKKVISEIDKIIALYCEINEDGGEYLNRLLEIKAQMFFKIGKDKEAFECYEKKKDWCDIATKCDFIGDLIEDKKYDAALNFLKTWDPEFKSNIYTFKKGFCLQKSGKWEEAIVCYDYALQHELYEKYDASYHYPFNPSEKDYLCNKVLCLMYLCKFDESKDVVAKFEEYC
jgi:tetratricopeptide (TPR) repeat protein